MNVRISCRTSDSFEMNMNMKCEPGTRATRAVGQTGFDRLRLLLRQRVDRREVGSAHLLHAGHARAAVRDQPYRSFHVRPKGRLEGAEDFFYWTKDKFGPKPTISLYHLTLWQDSRRPDRALACAKRIYASHYFQAGLDLVALVDAPPARRGFYLMDLHRVRIDPPTGMLSGVLLGKIRGGIEAAVTERLESAKALAESR